MAADFYEAGAVEDDDQVRHPHGAEAMRDQDRDATHRGAARRLRVAGEQRVFGLGVQRRRRLVKNHQQWLLAHVAPREGQFLPLAEAQFLPLGPGRPQLTLQPFRQSFHDVGRARSVDGPRHGRLVIEPRQVTQSDAALRGEFEAVEVLEGTGDPRSPFVGGHPAQWLTVDEHLTRARLVHLRQ